MLNLPRATKKEMELAARDFDKFIAGIPSSYTVHHDRTTFVSPKEVKAARTVTKLTQAGFAEALGISKDTVQAWENGRRRPRGLESKVLKTIRRDPRYIKIMAHV